MYQKICSEYLMTNSHFKFFYYFGVTGLSSNHNKTFFFSKLLWQFKNETSNISTFSWTLISRCEQALNHLYGTYHDNSLTRVLKVKVEGIFQTEYYHHSGWPLPSERQHYISAIQNFFGSTVAEPGHRHFFNFHFSRKLNVDESQQSLVG